jgi:hypothetical protein
VARRSIREPSARLDADQCPARMRDR